MKTYLLRVCFICLCSIGVTILISSISSSSHSANAADHINFTETLGQEKDEVLIADLLKQARTFDYREVNHYGIAISKTCYTIHRYAPVNSTSPCPTYEAIMLLYPDTSNQDYTGKFIYKHNMLQREMSKEGHKDIYKYIKESVLFIDPPFDIQNQLHMIRIESSMDFYKPRGGFGSKIMDGVLYQSDTRYIDSCRNAVIAARDWINLIGDTLNYMRNSCDPFATNYNFTRVINQNLTDHDITTSNKWLHEQFVEWVKLNCIYEYDKC